MNRFDLMWSWTTKCGYGIELSLNNVDVGPLLKMNLFVVVLQGSYGVVKLAYNEDDDKHYVSQCNFFLISWNAVPLPHSHSSPLSFRQASQPLLSRQKSFTGSHQCYWFFSIHLVAELWVPSPQIVSVALEETWKWKWLLVPLKVHPRLYYLSLKQRRCFVYQVAALRSVHKGESGYEPARWD